MSALRTEYDKLKAKYPQAILMFECREFIEVFDMDAVNVANITGTILTKSSSSFTSVTGFASSMFDTYAKQLIKAGYCIALVQESTN